MKICAAGKDFVFARGVFMPDIPDRFIYNIYMYNIFMYYFYAQRLYVQYL